MGMEVLTFCPPSGLGDMMVTSPFSPIFRYPFISNHSSGISLRVIFLASFVVHEFSQLKPIIIPPPARAVHFRKDRLLYVVLTCCMFIVSSPVIF